MESEAQVRSANCRRRQYRRFAPFRQDGAGPTRRRWMAAQFYAGTNIRRAVASKSSAAVRSGVDDRKKWRVKPKPRVQRCDLRQHGCCLRSGGSRDTSRGLISRNQTRDCGAHFAQRRSRAQSRNRVVRERSDGVHDRSEVSRRNSERCPMLMCMSTKQQSDQQSEKQIRAEAHFKARELLRADADQARHDYHSAQTAVLNRTERLRKERLAWEARQNSRAPLAASTRTR